VALDEPGDRRVIGPLLRRDHPERHVLDARPLDHPRGPRSTRIRVEQQRQHHRRLIGRPAAPVLAVGRIERRHIDPLDGIDHEPREVFLRQPIPDVRRQQERLLTITRNKAGRHDDMVLTAPDDNPVTRQPHAKGALRSCGRTYNVEKSPG
jgi:hypothetical protein